MIRALAVVLLLAGIEVECRIANAISPGHYARGWHITATCGVFGAAAAAGRLLGLDAQQLAWAFGGASARAGGLVETLGTMAKSLGVGQAAADGVLAALLAQQGFDGPAAPLEGERGFLRVFSSEVQWDALAPGGRWELLANTYKPYPCGVVLNPVIEACLALRPQLLADALPRLAQVVLRGHPLLRQRTDRPAPASGKLAQVSAQHAVAVALARGRAGLADFSDDAVRDPLLRELGAKVRFVDDPTFAVEAAEVQVLAADGQQWTHRVDAARGSLAAPLTDADLAAKLRGNAAFAGSGADAGALLDALWHFDEAADAAALLQWAIPPAKKGPPP